MPMNPEPPVGCDRQRSEDMTTKTLSAATTASGLMTIAGVALAGIFLLAIAGYAQASVLHDSAHNTRHAIAFPCH